MESYILDAIQSLRSDFLDNLMLFFTYAAEKGIVWIVFGIILVIIKKTRMWGIILLVSITAGFLIGEVALKNIICRVRPWSRYYDTVKDTLLIRPTSYSFPSGHSTSSFAASYSLFSYKKRIGIIAYAFACAVAFSRMYLYVHYPSDILAGILLGTTCAVITCVVVKKKFNSGEKTRLSAQ